MSHDRKLGRRRSGPERRRVLRGALALSMVAGGLLSIVPLAGVADASPSWSAPAPVAETTPGQLSSVSCPTAGFCMAVDFNGRALTYNGQSWSSPINLGGTGPVSSVSCASANFCAAVDYNGEAFVYSHHHWSAPDVLDDGIAMPSVSCAPGTSFCIAVSGDGGPVGFVYSGGSWGPAVLMDTAPTSGMGSVSCLSTSFCMAVDVSGDSVTSTDGGNSWSAPDSFDAGSSPDSVSCGTPNFCVAVDEGGQAIAYTGGSWGDPEEIDGERLASVSCLAGGDCVAVDGEDDGFYTTDSGATWTAAVGIGPGQFGVSLAVSCVSWTDCLVVDSIGQDFTFDNGTWSAPIFFDGSGTNMPSVSCLSSIFCAAVDSDGNAFTYDGSEWSSADHIDGTQVDAVSCATASLCVAVDDSGQEVTYNGTTWSGPTFIDSDGFGLTSVSCTATPTTFCAAVDSDGNVLTSDDGTSWSALSSIDSGRFLTSVSCATAAFCAAVDTDGDVLLYDGTSWSAPLDIDGESDLVSVSCTTTPSAFCAAVDSDGNGFQYDGSWTAADFSDENTPTAVSCATATFCQVADSSGHVQSFFEEMTPVFVDPGNSLNAISCPAATFCAAVDSDGNAALYEGTVTGVAVSAVSPNTGPTSGGTSVTITGSGFSPASEVDFAGTEATGIDVVDATTITASAPPGTAGTVDVIVTTSGGSSTPNAADQFTYTEVQSPSNADCDPSCTETVSTPLNQTQVSVTGSSDSPTAQVSLVVNTDTLTCSGSYDYATPVSTLSSTGFEPGATVTATVTVGQEPKKKGVKVCYGTSSDATTGTFLGHCSSHTAHPPCIESLVDHDDTVVATLLVPAVDPRFWAGTGALDLTSFSPTHGAPGKKVTIKGKDLSQVTAVVIGGAQARILSRSASKVVATVPQGAVTGPISVTADSGVVLSELPFTVT